MGAEGLHRRRAVSPVPKTDPDRGHVRGGQEFGEERFLRPFAVAAGDPGSPMLGVPDTGESGPGLLSLVVAARRPGPHEWLRPERETILKRTLRARTVAELAAEVRLPVGQVRGIVSDMITDGSLQPCGPSRSLGHEDILHAVLVGLRSL